MVATPYDQYKFYRRRIRLFNQPQEGMCFKYQYKLCITSNRRFDRLNVKDELPE